MVYKERMRLVCEFLSVLWYSSTLGLVSLRPPGLYMTMSLIPISSVLEQVMEESQWLRVRISH